MLGQRDKGKRGKKTKRRANREEKALRDEKGFQLLQIRRWNTLRREEKNDEEKAIEDKLSEKGDKERGG